MNFTAKPQVNRLYLCALIYLATSMPAELAAQSEKEITAPSTTQRPSQVGARNPLLEFIRHIAETDNLYDPERLFSKTMGVVNPPKPEVSPRALLSGLKNQPHWPVGIRSVHYMLVFPTPEKTPTRRSLDFSLDTELNCIRLADIVSNFGYAPTRLPPSIFTHPVQGDPHTMELKSPELFEGNASSSIQFGFHFNDCAASIFLSNPLDFNTYTKLQKVAK